MTDSEPREISESIGIYKAESFGGEQLYNFYTEPAYFSEISAVRSCILVGGRGTGKTTILKCLSYEGQSVLSEKQIPEWKSYGIYYKFKINHVAAFSNSGLSEQEWTKIFGHYINLLICGLLLDFVDWFQKKNDLIVDLSEEGLENVSLSLCIDEVSSLEQLRKSIRKATSSFSTQINAIRDIKLVNLSLLGYPFEYLIGELVKTNHFQGKTFVFLIDEYENLQKYQQKILNTLIKHSTESHCFKVGVRELGFQDRSTLQSDQYLMSPADFALIDIGEKFDDSAIFSEFARSVCNKRLKKLYLEQVESKIDVKNLFESLDIESEAIRLGVKEHVSKIKQDLMRRISPEGLNELNSMKNIQIYLLGFWAESKNMTIQAIFNDYMNNRSQWKTRENNYSYAALFTIKRNKSGIRKYYAGWDTFIQISAGNIRFLLALVEQSLIARDQDDKAKKDIQSPVSCEIQTDVAQKVGYSYLREIEGMSAQGSRLGKLVVGLGRVFQVLAAQAEGHAPEVTQFHFHDENKRSGTNELMRDAIMHLALRRFSGTKLDKFETKDYDYALHPIFTPYFVFSHRKKRKIQISEDELARVISSPASAVKSILIKNKRPGVTSLPDQMGLFSGYFNVDS
jgi:hypothetical protein